MIDLNKFAVVHTLRGGHDSYVNAVVVSREGNLAASGSDDGVVTIWNLTTRTPMCMCQIKELSAGVNAVILRERLVFVGMRNGRLLCFDCDTGKQQQDMHFAGHGKSISCIAMTARLLLTGSEDMTVRMWALTPEHGPLGEEVRTLRGHGDTVTAIVPVGPEGANLVTASIDSTIRLWDMDTGTLLSIFTGESPCDVQLATQKNINPFTHFA